MDDTEDDADGKPPRRRGRGAARPGATVDHAFDLWLERGLHQLYDNVAKEPIPDELLRLIEDDKAERGK